VDDRGGEAEVNIQADREYFEKVCPVPSVIEKVRAQEKIIPGSHFGLFFHLFRKLRELPYQPSSEQRYECLFDIIRMGNCVDEGNLAGKEDNDFFKIIKLYRHRVVHGFHAVKPDTSDELIHAYISYLQNFSDERKVESFKKNFQNISDEGKLHSYIKFGNKKEIIQKILSQMKYFFEKAKSFLGEGKLEAASLAYIAGAKCGVDIENFYITTLKKDKTLNLKKCSATKCIEHYSAKGVNHIAELLLIIQDLKAKRTEFFAHQGSTSAKNDGDAFLQNVFLKEYEEKFVNGLYVKIVSYLNTEFRTGLLEFEKSSSKNPSPRAYDPEAIKSGARNIAQEEDEELEEQKEESMPQAPLGRKDETGRRGKREGREPMERQEGEKRRKDKEARKEERPRDREEEEDARKRKDAERHERRERERRRKDRERREEQDSRDREDEERRRGGSRRGDERGHRKSDGGRNESESRRGFRK